MLVREADRAIVEVPGGWRVPNDFTVVMGGEPVDGEVIDAVQHELATFVEESALERGWRLEGPARVRLTIEAGRRPTDVAITAEVAASSRPVWARLTPIDTPGVQLDIAINRALIGRGSGADVKIPNDDVSRIHAVIWREAGSSWVGDLESSNGTFLNGERVFGPTPIKDGDLLTFGRTEYLMGRP